MFWRKMFPADKKNSNDYCAGILIFTIFVLPRNGNMEAIMEEILKFKKANCKNCFKCLRECPVKAIAIHDGQAEILRDDCLICGHCLTVCPQNAKVVRSDTGRVKKLIDCGRKVFASVAPSFAAAFNTDFDGISLALKSLGFSGAAETSEGAVPVTREYERLLEQHKMPCVISSACPTIVKLINMYHPQVANCLAPIVSPMTAHARMLKKRYGDISVVFIGPCISKKDEAEWYGDAVDIAITFEELQNWFEADNISLKSAAARENASGKFSSARFYPTNGGIIKSMKSALPFVKYITVEGMEKCINVLKELENGNAEGFFIEMSACAGSCINGPCMTIPCGGYLAARKMMENYAESGSAAPLPDNESSWKGVELHRDFEIKPHTFVKPGEREIRAILAKTGKLKKEDELNCGACGYATCREKAIAVYQGKAEVSMCMPYMRERAEYISDKVISFSPDAIIVLDKLLNITAMNNAACRLFEIDDAKEYGGRYIGELTDSSAFEEAVVRRENVLNKKIYLFRYGKYVEQSVIYVKEHNMLFAIIRDLTESEKQNEKMKKVKMETVRTADNVVEKQMRIVQEIAMLLGETTAETKVALTKLKGTIMSEEE